MKILDIKEYKKKVLVVAVCTAMSGISGVALAAISDPTSAVVGRAPSYASVGIHITDSNGDGVVSVGDTLGVVLGDFVDPDGDTAITPLYQWTRGGSAIATGGTGASYSLTEADISEGISVLVTARTDEAITNPAEAASAMAASNVTFGAIGSEPGEGTSIGGDGVVTVDADDVISVSITGASAPNPIVGDTLTANPICTTGEACTGGSVSYQWKLNGVDIGSATNSTYTVRREDQRQTITVEAVKMAATRGTSKSSR